MPAVNRTTDTSASAAGVVEDGEPLLGCLHVVTRLCGRPVSTEALTAGIPLKDGRFGTDEFMRAAAAHGYSARLVRRKLGRISALALPATLLLEDGGACVLTRFIGADTVEIVVPESGFGAREVGRAELQKLYRGYAIFARPELEPEVSRDGGESATSRRSWFWGTLVTYAPYYFEAAVAGILINVLTVATSLFIMNVYDRVVPNNATETLIVLATGTAFAIGFEFVARSLRAYFLDMAGKKADLVLASRIFEQALGLKLSARPQSAGAFAAQLREFEAVRDFITSITLTAVMDMPFVAFFIVVIAAIGGPLYLVPLAVVPLVLMVALLAQIPLSRATRANLQQGSQRHGLLVEAVEGLDIIKAMRAEGQMQGRYEDYTALTGATANTARMISSTVVNFTGVIQQFVTVVVVVWGVHLIADGDLTMGALIATVMLTSRGLAPLQQVAALMMRYQHARAAYFTLDTLMRLPVDRPYGKRFTHRGEVHGALAMDGVHFAYPQAPGAALVDISFALAPGEHVAVLGKVGGGKSTLLRLVLGLYPPAKGNVRVDGIDIEQFDPADLRRHIGYVGQEPMLFHGNLRDNIALGLPHADDEAVLRAAKIAGLDTLIDSNPRGLQLQVGERGQALSGGQRQAVANARAFLLEPSILLLDEPTSAMDNNAEVRFMQNVGAFADGRTMILVTHKPSMLSMVSRIIVLDNGRVAMDGPRDDVLRQLTRPLVPAS